MKYTISNDMRRKIDSPFQKPFAVERDRRGKDNMELDVLIGPPSIGKTRLLLELCNVLSEEANVGAFYLITFSGSSGIAEYDQMERVMAVGELWSWNYMIIDTTTPLMPV